VLLEVPEPAAAGLERILVPALEDAGCPVREIAAVPAGAAGPEGEVRRLLREECRFVLVVGGDGEWGGVPDLLTPLVERPVPGIPETIRQQGLALTPLAVLFRGGAGLTRDGALLVQLPAEEEWLRRSLFFLAAVLGHALSKAAGDPGECAR
jgi:molybdopterin biosynthesis enzyme MoaB